MPRRGRKTKRTTGPASCQSCRARIVFVTMTATGKSVPVDPIPVDDGNVCALTRPGGRLIGYVISEAHPPRPGYTRYAAHFGTCPSRQKTAPKPAPETAPTLFDTEPDTCRPVEVDGEIIRVHGSGEMTEEDRGHFAEIVRAAKRRYERGAPVHKPFPDDGVTYCGWHVGNGVVHEGCGEVWPCSTVRSRGGV